MQPEGHRTASTVAIGQRRDRPAGALGAVEVAGRGLHVDGGRDRARAGRRSRRASGRGGRRVAAAPRSIVEVHRRRAPAGRLDPSPHLLDQSARCRCRRGVRGIGREEAPEVAEPGRAEQARRTRRGARRRRRNGRPGRGAPSIATPPSRSGAPGPNGWLSWPIPVRVRAGAARTAERERRPPEIGRERHLDIAWIAGDHMDSDATGFEQRGLVGERLRAVGREAAPGVAEEVAASALRRLGGAQPGPLDRRRRRGRRRSA